MSNSSSLSSSSMELSTMVEGCLIPMVATFGTLGNLASISVLRNNSLDMKETFREILIMLTVFDTIFVLSATTSFSLPVISPNWKAFYHPFLLPWLLPIMQISLNGSIWSTVFVAVERFISVVHPRVWISSFSSIIYIIPTILLSIIWNIPRFNELFTCIRRDNMTIQASQISINSTFEDYSICSTPMRTNPRYIRDYILLANFFMMAFLPFLILTITNALLYRTISSISNLNKKTTSRQKRDQSIAMILVGIVIVFGFCNIFRIIINLYEVFHLAVYGGVAKNWPKWCSILSNFSHLFLVLNSSVNIIIYGWKDNKFREVLLQQLHLNCCMKENTSLVMSNMSMIDTPMTMVNRVEDNTIVVHDSLL